MTASELRKVLAAFLTHWTHIPSQGLRGRFVIDQHSNMHVVHTQVTIKLSVLIT